MIRNFPWSHTISFVGRPFWLSRVGVILGLQFCDCACSSFKNRCMSHSPLFFSYPALSECSIDVRWMGGWIDGQKKEGQMTRYSALSPIRFVLWKHRDNGEAKQDIILDCIGFNFMWQKPNSTRAKIKKVLGHVTVKSRAGNLLQAELNQNARMASLGAWLFALCLPCLCFPPCWLASQAASSVPGLCRTGSQKEKDQLALCSSLLPFPTSTRYSHPGHTHSYTKIP